jgi:hypothetical protein
VLRILVRHDVDVVDVDGLSSPSSPSSPRLDDDDDEGQRMMLTTTSQRLVRAFDSCSSVRLSHLDKI